LGKIKGKRRGREKYFSLSKINHGNTSGLI